MDEIAQIIANTNPKEIVEVDSKWNTEEIFKGWVERFFGSNFEKVVILKFPKVLLRDFSKELPEEFSYECQTIYKRISEETR